MSFVQKLVPDSSAIHLDETKGGCKLNPAGTRPRAVEAEARQGGPGGQTAGEVACLICVSQEGEVATWRERNEREIEANRKVGAERRVAQRKRAAMRQHLGPDQKHRQTDCVATWLAVGTRTCDLAACLTRRGRSGGSTWHARVAIPAPQIRRRLLESG